MIKIAQYPFVFWFMRNIEINFLDDSICTINSKQYNYKAFNKYIFLALKYILPTLIIYFIYTKADFSFEIKRLIELFLGLYLAVTLILKRILLFRIGLLVTICVCILFLEPAISAFVAKYFLTIFIFYSFKQDCCVKVFSLSNNNLLITHFITRNE
ncbi:hypothetical protein [Helicobacter sp. MIT 14-3879]|uniref:hypothetical protein n=1 Tax=Helicobacter sp. MIT 14-3879 TaxID=2040649 RepID=UPI000E1F6E6A|nr:hypothetical protein [Helicobacter sp. MIT 14-3879]RDU61860.1 hypothetical protein CQA44_07995 [Helicobacter sp. MIT 14-3879]